MRADSHSRLRLVVGGGAIAAMVVIGALLVALGSPDRGKASDSPVDSVRPTVPVGVAGPVAEEAGLPAGFAHDRDGATAAAIAYATAPQRWLYFTDDEIVAAVEAIATPVAGPRLSEEVVTDVRTARERLGESPGRVWWLVRPMAWRIESFTPDEASVSVWTVTVLSAEEVAAPQCEWITVTVDLAWIEGDWRVDGVRDTPGPTPMTGPGDQPWDAVPFDEALAGFTRMDGEPVT